MESFPVIPFLPNESLLGLVERPPKSLHLDLENSSKWDLVVYHKIRFDCPRQD